MVVGDLIPNDDVSVAWAVYPFPNAIHYVLIDEDKGSPTVPLTGDAINGTGIGGEDNAVDDFRLSSLEDIDEATQAVAIIISDVSYASESSNFSTITSQH